MKFSIYQKKIHAIFPLRDRFEAPGKFSVPAHSWTVEADKRLAPRISRIVILDKTSLYQLEFIIRRSPWIPLYTSN